MAAKNYPEALSRVLAHEGGYTNHPQDPGGPTNWGITIKDAQMYWKRSATAADVKAMPRSVACDIYRQKYWDAQNCDKLPSGVDYIVFDYGVNSGIGRSGRVLRRIVGLPSSTSTVTNDVLAAAAARSPDKLVDALCDERLKFLMSLKTWKTFGGGWGRRVKESRAAAHQMIAKDTAGQDPISAQPPLVTPPPAAVGRGVVPVPAIASPKSVEGSTAVAGGGAVVATVAANSGSSNWVVWVIVGAVVVAFVIGIARWRINSRQNAPMPGTPIIQPEGAKP